MPQEKYDPTQDFGYGAGKSRLLAAYGEEKWEEAEKRDEDIKLAGEARSVEQERKSLWSLFLGGVGLAVGGPAGMAIGYGVGKGIRGLGTIGGKAAEEYMVSEDVGRFEASEAFELRDINRDLVAADKADFWGDVLDIGKVGALAFQMGGGSFTDPGNFSPWHIGGKEAATEGMYGAGLFQTPAGEWGTGAGTLWGRYRGKPSIFELEPLENVEAMRGSRARSGGTA